MSCSKIKQHEPSIKFVHTKQKEFPLLDVYYILDKPISYPFDFHFTDFIKDHNYRLNMIKELPSKKCDDNNILKRGIYNFENYFKSLKLKSPNTLWFVYIGTEFINDNRQLNIMMISENPKYGKNEFIYHISRNKKFSNYMMELFKNQKKLMYNINYMLT